MRPSQTSWIFFFQTGRRGVIVLLPKRIDPVDLCLELLEAKEVSKSTKPVQKHPWRHSGGRAIWWLFKPPEALFILPGYLNQLIDFLFFCH